MASSATVSSWFAVRQELSPNRKKIIYTPAINLVHCELCTIYLAPHGDDRRAWGCRLFSSRNAC
jgi:hypothetical protein